MKFFEKFLCMRYIFVTFMLAPVLISLQGCGPQYATVHKISEPKSSNQYKCAGDCDRVSAICHNMCKRNEARCFDLQRHSIRGGYNYNPYDYFNSGHFYNCDFVFETCMRDCAQNKLLCYSNCGLTISSHQICVENCDEQ